MSDPYDDRRGRLAARLGAEASPAAPLPDVIQLPDLSPPTAAPMAAAVTAGRKKGLHLGGRRVEHPRSARLALRVTEAQGAALREAARKARMSVTAFVCWRCLGDQPPRAAPGPETQLLRQILAQLGKRGANLNQIERHLTDCRAPDPAVGLVEMRRDHAAALAEHREACRIVMKTLGASGKPAGLDQEPDGGLLRQALAQLVEQGGCLNRIAQRLNGCGAPGLGEAVAAVRPDHAAALAEHRDVCRVIMQSLRA